MLSGVRGWAIRMAGAVCLCGCAGCITNKQEGFYERYAGTCKVSTRPPIQAAPPGSGLSDGRAAFARKLNEHADELRECYQDALAYGETQGTIVMEIVLNTDGSANPVTIVSDTNRFAPLACCVLGVVRATQYDPGAVPTRFDYPFAFNTTEQALPVYQGGAAWSRWYADSEGFQAVLDVTMTLAGRVPLVSTPVAGEPHQGFDPQSNGGDAGSGKHARPGQDPQATPEPQEQRFPTFPHSGPY